MDSGNGSADETAGVWIPYIGVAESIYGAKPKGAGVLVPHPLVCSSFRLELTAQIDDLDALAELGIDLLKRFAVHLEQFQHSGAELVRCSDAGLFEHRRVEGPVDDDVLRDRDRHITAQ